MQCSNCGQEGSHFTAGSYTCTCPDVLMGIENQLGKDLDSGTAQHVFQPQESNKTFCAHEYPLYDEVLNYQEKVKCPFGEEEHLMSSEKDK